MDLPASQRPGTRGKGPERCAWSDDRGLRASRIPRPPASADGGHAAASGGDPETHLGVHSGPGRAQIRDCRQPGQRGEARVHPLLISPLVQIASPRSSTPGPAPPLPVHQLHQPGRASPSPATSPMTAQRPRWRGSPCVRTAFENTRTRAIGDSTLSPMPAALRPEAPAAEQVRRGGGDRRCLRWVSAVLTQGAIVAVKGIGGFHSPVMQPPAQPSPRSGSGNAGTSSRSR